MRVRGKITLGIWLILIAAAAIAAPGVLEKLKNLTRPAVSEIPTVRVTRGPIETTTYVMGELRPSKIATLVAPPVGGTLQIVHIAQTGTFVKEGDIVVEFDPVEQEYTLDQNRSQLEEADQQIKKLQADIAVRRAQDNVSLMSARFNVRRAELRVRENELLSAIDARRNELALEEAKRRLEQLERDLKTRATSDQADLVMQNQNRVRATMQMKMAQQNIDNMTLKAPIGGVVVSGQNYSIMMVGEGMLMSSGATDFREGDSVSPGMTIAQIQDVAQMEIACKVAEIDRGNLNPGQPIQVYVDSLPTLSFSGKVKSLAGMASTSTMTITDFYAGTRSFDATFEVDCAGKNVNPGVSARIEVRGSNMDQVLSLPRQALFTREGKSIVYIKRPPADWEACPVQIKYLTESRAAIEGLTEGTEVAMLDPNSQKAKAGRKAGALSSIIGGVIR